MYPTLSVRILPLEDEYFRVLTDSSLAFLSCSCLYPPPRLSVSILISVITALRRFNQPRYGLPTHPAALGKGTMGLRDGARSWPRWLAVPLARSWRSRCMTRIQTPWKAIAGRQKGRQLRSLPKGHAHSLTKARIRRSIYRCCVPTARLSVRSELMMLFFLGSTEASVSASQFHTAAWIGRIAPWSYSVNSAVDLIAQRVNHVSQGYTFRILELGDIRHNEC